MDPNRFPETSPSLLFRLGETVHHRAGLEDLCRRYWRPVFCYVRVAWAKSDEDARDLAQAFFLWLLEGEPLKTYTPERGGFRTFLKVLLRRFVGHQERALQRIKRGGGIDFVPLEDLGLGADPQDSDPEVLFDRAWVTEVVNQAMERVRKRYSARDQSSAFAVYEGYELVPAGERPTYAELGRRLGLETSEVKKHLFAIRDELRREIRRDLRCMTSDDRELEEEWSVLFRS